MDSSLFSFYTVYGFRYIQDPFNVVVVTDNEDCVENCVLSTVISCFLHRFYDRLVVPIIDNAPEENDLLVSR